MLPATPYREQSYPPAGRQWPQFGDPKLDQAFASLTQEMRANLAEKRDGMHQIHMERLRHMNLAAPAPASPPLAPQTPPTRGPTHYYIYQRSDRPEQQEEFHDAEEGPEPPGPSNAQRLAKGLKHVAKEYVWPITRHVVAPAMGKLGVHGLTGAAWLIGKSFWTLWDVLEALGPFGDSSPDYDPGPAGPALGGPESYGALGNGGHAEEVERLAKKTKGGLMEEIYQQPGWARLFGRTDSRGYTNDDKNEWRQKMRDMSNHDLAEILVKLKSRS